MFLSNEPFSLIYVARYNKDENERLTNLLLLVAQYSFLPEWLEDTNYWNLVCLGIQSSGRQTPRIEKLTIPKMKMRNEKRERVVSNIHRELRKEMHEYKELDELNPSKCEFGLRWMCVSCVLHFACGSHGYCSRTHRSHSNTDL